MILTFYEFMLYTVVSDRIAITLYVLLEFAWGLFVNEQV